jgi:hypothetical protein
MAMRMGWSTAMGTEDGAAGGGVTVSSCERHDEWFIV